MDQFGPFNKLPEYPFLFCSVCQYACITGEASTHLRKHHAQLHIKTRKDILSRIQSIPGIIQNQDQLRHYTFPTIIQCPISLLGNPKTDGLGCNICPYIVRTRQGIRDHYRDHHYWKNDWKQSNNFLGIPQTNHNVPWSTDITCQRFFPSRAGSHWIRVQGCPPKVSSPPPNTGTMEWVRQCHKTQEVRFQEAATKVLIHGADPKNEPNAWLARVGWPDHLSGIHHNTLRELARLPSETEDKLGILCHKMSHTLDYAQALCRANKVGRATLFEINRREVSEKPANPLEAALEEDTWRRYKQIWLQILCVIYRTQQQDKDTRPPYRFTTKQQVIWDQIVVSLSVISDNKRQPLVAASSTCSLDRSCLELSIALLNHQTADSEYQNALISALAVLGVRDDGGWEGPSDYTPKLSAVVKVARLLAISWAYHQREDEVRLRMDKSGLDEYAARESIPGLFSRVREMVQSFMTRVGDQCTAGPGPMDWILETRTYGLHIHFNTTAGGSIEWDEDQVRYKATRVSMRQLTELMHAVLGEAQELLGELTMVKAVEQLPKIPWARLEDDNSDERPGYSFLEDTRNTWLAEGQDWMLRRIGADPTLEKRWIVGREEREKNPNQPYKERAIRAYSKSMEAFREKLWVLMHLTSGQPARVPEILGIRFRNTRHGGARNILINKQQVSFVTLYHKNFRQSGQGKVIHRFLPDAVGQLLVWYLWLVNPFWEQVQGMVKRADLTSAFLWGEETTYMDREDDQETAYADWLRSRKWTPDRMRRVLQQHTERLLGVSVTVSAWRHIAIAISNRYLRGQHGAVKGGPEFEDDEGIDDEAEDLQAGHGTAVAGMVYAREVQQGLEGTATSREKFRGVSTRWHLFFGLGSTRAAPRAPKRKREEYERAWDEVRFRRFQRLQHVDVAGQLQLMMGPGHALRGHQEGVVRAVIRGETPIVQIARTGGGKSLSFMLPAFCSPEGTTVVVAPLVALQEDLRARCVAAGITASIWRRGQGVQVASVVLVTPESAVTLGFGEYVRRLQTRGVLDRVVVDECHTLLDGSAQFRPKLAEVGRVTRDWGVQRVFLTATLGPAEMERFRGVAALGERAKVYRSPTTRSNIRYTTIRVQGCRGEGQEEREDRAVCELVRRRLAGDQESKAIVYAGTVARVERLAELLGCEAYHHRVDSSEGKQGRMRSWIAAGRVIVATNALGLGIDVANVRLVVHAWMPRTIRDYVQESGRAGRDGQASEAIVIHGMLSKATDGGPEAGGWREASTVDYVEAQQCRRKVLDQYMDGRLDRTACEEGEQPCDRCDPVKPSFPDQRGESGRGTRDGDNVDMDVYQGGEDSEDGEDGEDSGDSGDSEDSEDGEDGEDGEDSQGSEDEGADEAKAKDGEPSAAAAHPRLLFQKQQNEVRLERWQGRQSIMEEASTRERLEALLDEWDQTCIGCRFGRAPGDHKMEACTHRNTKGYQAAMVNVRTTEREIFTRRRLANYSGCFGCALPQSICNTWAAVDGDEGRHVRVPGASCQYKGLLIRFYGVGALLKPELFQEASGQENVFSQEFYVWAGRRIKWGGMEATEMARGFVKVCALLEAERRSGQ